MTIQFLDIWAYIPAGNINWIEPINPFKNKKELEEKIDKLLDYRTKNLNSKIV